jgi:hypothetical protein
MELVRTLPRAQVADLAYEVLGVLDGDETDPINVQDAWRSELERRVHDLESGAVELVNHQETVSMARTLLAELS